MIDGIEFHQIIGNIFPDTRGLGVSSQLQTCCPRCQERDGLLYADNKFNLEISTHRNRLVFRCWRCSEPNFSGSLGKLIRLYGTKIDYDLYKSYLSVYGNYSSNDYDEEKEYVQVSLPQEMILFSQMDVNNSEHFEAYNYLINDRKINREKILKYRIGFCTTGKYAKRIIFPSYDRNGDINYFVARAYDRKLKNKYDNPKSNKDLIIFNEGYINWDSPVCLVEGVTDMFSVPNAIPLLGKTLSTTLFLRLKELKPQVIVLLDPDAYANAIDLFYMLETIYVGCEDSVKIVKLPTKDDVDELRRNFGEEEVIKALYTARSLITDDYFMKKLQKPYDSSRERRGYDSDSKNFDWKSGSTKNYL